MCALPICPDHEQSAAGFFGESANVVAGKMLRGRTNFAKLVSVETRKSAGRREPHEARRVLQHFADVVVRKSVVGGPDSRMEIARSRHLRSRGCDREEK